MISIKLKEDKQVYEYDYSIKSLEELDELCNIIYKPIIGTYTISLTLSDLKDIKTLLYNKSRYEHLSIHVLLTEAKYKEVSLALPNEVLDEKISLFEYLKDGITKRHLIIKNKVLSLLYSSVDKSYEAIDEVLDLLASKYGKFSNITKDDLSKVIVIKDIVYPRTVLIEYINLGRYRKYKLEKCLSDISSEIVLASMIKNVKKLHEDKSKYLRTGVGKKYIRDLNTRNLNLMYYTLVIAKPYNINDICILLSLYERGTGNIYDI